MHVSERRNVSEGNILNLTEWDNLESISNGTWQRENGDRICNSWQCHFLDAPYLFFCLSFSPLPCFIYVVYILWFDALAPRISTDMLRLEWGSYGILIRWIMKKNVFSSTRLCWMNHANLLIKKLALSIVQIHNLFRSTSFFHSIDAKKTPTISKNAM